MEMANKAYTKEILTELVNQLGIKTKYDIDPLTQGYEVNFYRGEYRSGYVELQIENDLEKSNAYQKRHPDASIYNIVSVELAMFSIRTSDLDEAEYSLMQFKDALKVTKLFQKIVENKSVFIKPMVYIQ